MAHPNSPASLDGRIGPPILLAIVVLGLATPARADQAIGLVELFSRTCALVPARPSALHQRALLAGFNAPNGPPTPELERAPTLNVIYSATFARADMRVGLSSFFYGPGQEIEVSCSLNSEGVTPDGLRAELEGSLRLGEPTDLSDGADRMQAGWRTPVFDLSISVHKSPPYRGMISSQYRRPRT